MTEIVFINACPVDGCLRKRLPNSLVCEECKHILESGMTLPAYYGTKVLGKTDIAQPKEKGEVSMKQIVAIIVALILGGISGQAQTTIPKLGEWPTKMIAAAYFSEGVLMNPSLSGSPYRVKESQFVKLVIAQRDTVRITVTAVGKDNAATLMKRDTVTTPKVWIIGVVNSLGQLNGMMLQGMLRSVSKDTANFAFAWFPIDLFSFSIAATIDSVILAKRLPDSQRVAIQNNAGEWFPIDIIIPNQNTGANK